MSGVDYGAAAGALEALGGSIRDRRDLLGYSLREVGKQAGVSFSSVTRVEHGKGFDSHTAVALMRWLDSPSLPPECTRAPAGWRCSRALDHRPPCYVRETTS